MDPIIEILVRDAGMVDCCVSVIMSCRVMKNREEQKLIASRVELKHRRKILRVELKKHCR